MSRRRVMTAAAAALLLAGCGTPGGNRTGPDWRPKPSFQGEGNGPGGIAPVVPGPGTSTPARPPNSPSSSPSGGRSGGDPAVVARDLDAPTAIAILPDNTALVGERTTGRIVRVQPRPDKPVRTVRTIPHLSTVGGGGLMDLALSPNYAQDKLIFAYVSTATDNRVVDFTLHGPITPVLTGIPHGRRDNTGRIAFSPTGDLYIGTGDAGRSKAAKRPHSLAGKILRVTDIGRPAKGNPIRGSSIFASGLKQVNGLCIGARLGVTLETESRGTVGGDPVNGIVADGFYGWPQYTATDQSPLTHLPDTSSAPGGCAVLQNILFVTSLDGAALLAARLTPSPSGTVTVGRFDVRMRNKYGRLRTVVAAPDGALWLTTSNLDGHGTPRPGDEKVLRIVPSGGAGDKPT